MGSAPALGVVFDVNVYLDALLYKGDKFPELVKIPPKTGMAPRDCLSLAFDADRFSLHISPHIIENIADVLHKVGLPSNLIGESLQALVEIVQVSGGTVVAPPCLAFDSKDFEDNLVLDLLKYKDSKVLVTSDKGLLELNPWNHRLILSPMDFLEHIL